MNKIKLILNSDTTLKVLGLISLGSVLTLINPNLSSIPFLLLCFIGVRRIVRKVNNDE